MSVAAQAAESIGATVRPLYLSAAKVQFSCDRGTSGFDGDDDIVEDDDFWDSDLALAPMDDMDGIWDEDEVYVGCMKDEGEADDMSTRKDKAREPSVGCSNVLCERKFEKPTVPESQRLLSTVVYEAMSRATNRNTKETSSIVFHPVREVKARLAASLDDGDATLAARDLMSCRYSGLLESCSNNVLMYVPNAMGMDWRERIVRKELATQISFAKLYSQFGPINRDAQNGVVLVQNERMLEDIFFDKKSRRGENEVLGRSFNHYYVVQFNKEGMSDLKRIMTRNLEEDDRRFIDSAVRSGIYAHNTEVSAKLFPLKSKEGILIANGTLMDLVQVSAIESIANHLPDLKYGVLCRPYQLTYYQRIMPRAYFMLAS